MTMTKVTRWPLTVALLLGFAFSLLPARHGAVVARQAATPVGDYSCAKATPAVATPAMDGMAMGTPTAGMDMAMDLEFDQLYIDLTIPHHEAAKRRPPIRRSRTSRRGSSPTSDGRSRSFRRSGWS